MKCQIPLSYLEMKGNITCTVFHSLCCVRITRKSLTNLSCSFCCCQLAQETRRQKTCLPPFSPISSSFSLLWIPKSVRAACVSQRGSQLQNKSTLSFFVSRFILILSPHEPWEKKRVNILERKKRKTSLCGVVTSAWFSRLEKRWQQRHEDMEIVF